MLDLGCGTGILGIECALKGALVTALSQDPSMLARARSYAKVCGLDRAIRYIEGDLLSIDSIFEKEQFDVITANFILSELGSDEREILLRHVESLLSPEGRFIVADEIVPERCLRRALAAGVRWPLLSLAGLVSGHINRPLKGLESSLRGAGWRLRSRRSLLGGTISVLVAELH
jgi:2-polyprenyl-3-methyl-5-hydroxy-6-metoxy-1,4-benzoquinol methylase